MKGTYNTEAWKELTIKLGKLASEKIKVGIFKPKEARKGMFHEYGTRHMVARSWCRSTFRDRQVEIANITANAVRMVLKSKLTPNDGLKMIGQACAELMKEQIKSKGIWRPVLPETQRRKGPDRTRALVDDGDMWRAVTFKIVK